MIREILQPHTGLAFLAMRALRPQLSDEGAFVRHVDDVQRPEGYRIVGAFDDASSRHAIAVAGFRTGHSLAWGRFLYIDDLSTLPEARRRGHGRQLLEWVTDEARRLGCGQLHLDSGVGIDRVDAHRLYFNAGLHISGYHFARLIPNADGSPG
jgi:GNAT superfamily N-acetyltransferase